MPIVGPPPPGGGLDYQLTVNGLVMGSGTSYEFLALDGLDMPDLEDTNVKKLGADGEFPGNVTLKPRLIVATVEITGTAGADIATKVNAFATAFNRSNTEAIVTFLHPGAALRRVVGRPWRCKWAHTESFNYGLVVAVGEIRCADPRIFDDATSAEVLY